ncbi:hypothetical protein WJX82_002835 [Trebouxia sp. C0006]
MRRSSGSIKLSLLSSFKRRTEDDLDNRTAAEAAIKAVHDAEGTGQPFETVVENALHNETEAGLTHHKRPPYRGASLQNILGKASSFKRATSFVKNPSLQRNVSKVNHYLSLVVAENPLEAHREYKRRTQDDLQGGPALSRINSEGDMEEGIFMEREEDEWARQEVIEQWQNAGRSILSSVRMVRNAETLGDKFATGAERFAAVVELEMALTGNPDKKMLLRALARRRDNQIDNFFDRLITELFITGERIFDWFTPAAMYKHKLPFTVGFTAMMFIIFFYCAAEYPIFVQQFATFNPDEASVAVSDCYVNTNSTYYGPRQMEHWIRSGGAPWCFTNNAWTLSTEYLIEWGARWGPYMKKEPYRWVSSILIHTSFQHVLSNMLLFVVLSWQIEEKYGAFRVAFIFFWSAIGGNFFSAAFEDRCAAVAGASGGIFGLLGLFIADMVLNFETLTRPIMRGLLMVAFMVYFIVTVSTANVGVSNLSHVGGFICGLFPGFLFLPNLRSEKWEAALPHIGLVVALGVFVGLPCYFYKRVLPAIIASGSCDYTYQF